jgi:exodeoxyribonuclease V alpha subunit
VPTETVIVDAVARVRFRSPDSPFCILIMESGISALGDLREPLEGERLKLFGAESNHPKFGKQFKFSRFERMAPVGTRAVRDYIVKVAKWVGPTIGDKIVSAYGDATLAVLKTEPERVAREIRGITQARAEEIAAELRGREKEEQMVLQLGELCSGRIPDNVMRAAKDRWGGDAPRMIRENPYLLTGLHGCGFKGADRVAEGLGIKGADPRRLAAALEYALKTEAARGGHTRLSIDEAERLAGELANCPITPEGIALALKGQAVLRGADFYALARYEAAEAAVAGHLQRLAAAGKELPHDPPKLDGCAADQAAAFGVCLGHPVSLLVGAPGTGKTWTLARIVEAYRGGKGNRIALAAPTGKAAKRTTESLAATCGGSACTIHRLLEPSRFDKGSGERMQFTRCEANPIEADLLVIDETSMLDVELAAELLSAVPGGCRVIFIGDDNQLPSVGPGAVLRDLLRAELPAARLTEIKRNAGEIVRACHAIKDGSAPAPNPKPLDLEGGHNWRHVEIPTEREIAEQIVWLVTDWAKAKGIATDEVMVVSPFNHLNERELSCRDFNERLQAALNPATPGTEAARGGIREGDRVVRLSNGMAEETVGDWEVPIVNGDLGRVTKLDKHNLFVTFEAPTRRVKLARREADLALAYALSCHKMQGSEARVIIIPLHKSFGIFPNREWVYTAFSRAKQILITVGTVATLGAWVRRQTNGLRKTGLASALQSGTGKEREAT